jgi:5-methylthioadenosine/S-adenosylhomocysteine deaminase
VNEDDILERVNLETQRMLERSGLAHLLDEPPTLWWRSHY